MRPEAIWSADMEQVRLAAPLTRSGRATTARRGAGLCRANPRPRPSKTLRDRGALLADIVVRRRRAQIAARHALEASGPAGADAAVAS